MAIRRLLARPGHTALLVAIVGAGIGAATTVFSVVDQLLLRPAPFAYADRLVDVLDTSRASRGGGNSLSMEKIAGWQAQPSVFERFEAYAPVQVDVTGDSGPERIRGLNVSLGLFSMIGVSPRLGRGFMPGDGRPGSERIAIVSEALWRRRFGAQPDALGRRLTLNDQDYTIVGVMPRRFRMLSDEEAVWLPVDVGASIGDKTLAGFYGLGRLAPGVRMPGAQRMADDIATRLQVATPLPRTWDLALEQKQIARVDPTTRTALLVLLGAVSFVLFITCANVANLFIAQAPLRLREMAIRAALGSGRARLVRSVLVESLLISASGGALGIVLARWGVDALLAAAPGRLAFMTTSTIELDARVIAVAIVLTLLTGLLTGLLPAIRGSKPDIESTLRGTAPAGRASYGRGPALLVLLEVAFSVLLLLGAGAHGAHVRESPGDRAGLRTGGTDRAPSRSAGGSVPIVGGARGVLRHALRAAQGGARDFRRRRVRRPAAVAGGLFFRRARRRGEPGRAGAGDRAVQYRHAGILPHPAHPDPRRAGLRSG